MESKHGKYCRNFVENTNQKWIKQLDELVQKEFGVLLKSIDSKGIIISNKKDQYYDLIFWNSFNLITSHLPEKNYFIIVGNGSETLEATQANLESSKTNLIVENVKAIILYPLILIRNLLESAMLPAKYEANILANEKLMGTVYYKKIESKYPELIKDIYIINEEINFMYLTSFKHIKSRIVTSTVDLYERKWESKEFHKRTVFNRTIYPLIVHQEDWDVEALINYSQQK